MCCEDPPPDMTFLGPPPKPPWLSYQLHCDGEGLVLQHEDQSSALPSSGKGVSKSTLNIIAIVLFSLAALFLVLAVLILWYKRKLLKRPKVDHSDEDADEEYQYLYNLRIRGKLWKVPPRVAMLLKPITNREKAAKPDKSPQQEKYVKDIQSEGLGTSFIEPERNSVCEVEVSNPDQTPQIYLPYSSLDRCSSTTSGISSDGEMRSGVDSCCYGTEDSPYRVQPMRRARGRTKRYHVRQQQATAPAMEDGELGDVEGSLESLAERERQYNKQRQLQKRMCPEDAGAPKMLSTIEVSGDEADISAIATSAPERPQSAIVLSNVLAGVMEAKGRVKKGIVQIFSKPPLGESAGTARSQEQEALGNVRGKKTLEGKENVEVIKKGVEKKQECSDLKENRPRNKRKKKRLNVSDEKSVETSDNLQNELRESNV